MLNRKKVKAFIDLFVTVVMLQAALILAEAQVSGFGTTTLLQIPGQFLVDTQLSSHGRFAVGVSETVEETDYNLQFAFAGLHVWDIDSFNAGQDFTSPAPIASFLLSLDHLHGNPIVGFGISPNERYVALRVNTTVQILTLPDLNQYTTMRFGEDDYQNLIRDIAWSPDSQMLMLVQGASEQFTVWDIATDATYVYETGYVRPDERRFEVGGADVEPMKNGWLVSDFADHGPAFMVCTWQLETCSSYTFDHSALLSVRHTTDGRIILTSELGTRAGIWQKTPSGTYELQDIVDGCIQDMSPLGNYVYAACWRSSQEVQILDSETGSVVHRFDYAEDYTHGVGTDPVWLPDEEHFVIVTPPPFALQLYQLGNEQPTDELLFPDDDAYQVTGVRFAPENVTPSISKDGKKILTDMGGVAFLTRVEN